MSRSIVQAHVFNARVRRHNAAAAASRAPLLRPRVETPVGAETWLSRYVPGVELRTTTSLMSHQAKSGATIAANQSCLWFTQV